MSHTAPKSAPWWCSPAGLAIGFLLPMYALVSYAVELDLQGLTARGFRFLSWPYLTLGAGLIVSMGLGGWLGQQITVRGTHPARTVDVDRATGVIGTIAIGAYAIWFREYLTHPGLLWAIVSGGGAPERGNELVTGVTSLANGGPVFFALYAWRSVFRRDLPMPRWMQVMCVTLGLLTAFRVYAWSERLALIEAVLPIALAWSVRAAGSKRALLRFAVRLGPFIALPLLMLYFGLAESVRSWSSDTYHGKLDFWDFVVGRIATYYYTSLNNGAGFLATHDWPSFRFEYVLNMLHTAPLSVGRLFSALVGGPGPTFDMFLRRYADVEFNNPSGLFMVVYDLGVPLAILYFSVVGIAAGALYRSYVSGSLTATLFYSIFFISYLEVFRYPYLGSGRAFAGAVCSLLVLGLVAAGRFRQEYHDVPMPVGGLAS